MSWISASAGAVEAMAESLLGKRFAVGLVCAACPVLLFEVPEIWEPVVALETVKR
jgi:hypothetical protein